MVSVGEAIAIAELCVYIPLFLLNVFVLFRHAKFRRQSGWIYAGIFCTVRISGSIFKIESARHPDSTSDAEWSGILQSVGLSPILLSTMGLLRRVNNQIVKEKSLGINSGNDIEMSGRRELPKWKLNIPRSHITTIIHIMQVPVVAALGLCIIGGLDIPSTTPSESQKGHKFTKIGIIIFLANYILLATLVVLTIMKMVLAHKEEKKIYFVVVAAIPLLGVRMLWSILATFSHNADFSITNGGKPWVNFSMAVVEELIIVCMYTVVGFMIAH